MDTNYTLGTRADSGEPVFLTPEERRHHIEIIGKTGTGKSTLLQNLMCTDFASGRGFAFIDPHGDQAAAIANATPPHRTNDVIYLDAADLSHSIGWNPLERVEPDRRAVVAAQIAQAFAGIWGLSTAETPRLLYVLDKALRLLLDNPADPKAGRAPGTTLLDLPRRHCHLWMPPALQAVLTSTVEMLGLQSSIRPCGAVGDRWPWWNPRIGAPST